MRINKKGKLSPRESAITVAIANAFGTAWAGRISSLTPEQQFAYVIGVADVAAILSQAMGDGASLRVMADTCASLVGTVRNLMDQRNGQAALAWMKEQ